MTCAGTPHTARLPTDQTRSIGRMRYCDPFTTQLGPTPHGLRTPGDISCRDWGADCRSGRSSAPVRGLLEGLVGRHMATCVRRMVATDPTGHALKRDGRRRVG
jgi:hypothetical protein